MTSGGAKQAGPQAGRSPARGELPRDFASREANEVSRVALFGGTFNPIHLGHLRAAEEVREALALAKVIFVPSADPPLKRDGTEPLASARQRLSWVGRAIADNPAFGVDALELEREGPSYTVDTLRVFAERLAPALPVFVIGSDAFAELALWREPEALLRLANFAVMTRPPEPIRSLAGWLPAPFAAAYAVSDDGREARHCEAPSWIRLVPITALDISSTDVRRRLSEGRSVRYLLPDSVLEEVTKSGVYGPTADPREAP